MTTFKKYWFCTLAGVLTASFYPLYMGVRVVSDMIADGAVLKENYPKYIIPYTPVSLAVITAVLFMPFFMKYAKKAALWAASAVSLCIFFIAELLLESKVIVTGTVAATLESWQMYMCYVPPQSYETRTWKAVDILIGEYSPLFKVHFYLIAVIIILSLLNCLYGFAQIVLSGTDQTRNLQSVFPAKRKARLNALIIQSVCSIVFLGLCIFACFTAFFRDGEITVSPLSAFLMCLFFVVFGMTAGIYAGSFLLGRKRSFSVILPSITASLTTLLMYIGELFLLSGHLYRLGNGFLFDGLPFIVLAPADLFIILLSGCIVRTIYSKLNQTA